MMIVRRLAVVAGLAAILAPLARLVLSQRRRKGRTVGPGSMMRNWPAAVGLAAGLVFIGILLWKPLPIQIPAVLDRVLLGLGSLFYFPAIGLYLWGLAALGREFGVSTAAGADLYADHRLVRKGPYRWVRHPMYLAVLLAAAGAALIFRTWAMLAFGPASLVVVRRAAHEESILADEFPAEWQEYSQEVPKWLPWCYKKRQDPQS